MCAIKVSLLAVRHRAVFPPGMALPATPCGVSYSLLPVYHMRKNVISQAKFLDIGAFFTVSPRNFRKILYKISAKRYTIR